MRTPGAPVSGSRTNPGRAARGRVRTCTPSVTLTRVPSRRVIPSAMLTSYGARTCAEPPPMFVVSRACRPTSATVASGGSGSVCSWLRSTVIPEAARRVSCSRRVGLSGSVAAAGQTRVSPSAPTRPASRKRRRTWSSTTSTATSPLLTAATSAVLHGLCSAGITRSRPPFAAAATDLVANQSDISSPSHPHSDLRMPLFISSCSVAGTPLTSLYAAITDHGSASWTAISNGSR